MSELIERIDARLINLWAEVKNCEFKHGECHCCECAQAKEIAQEYRDCKAALEQATKDKAELEYELGHLLESLGVEFSGKHPKPCTLEGMDRCKLLVPLDWKAKHQKEPS